MTATPQQRSRLADLTKRKHAAGETKARHLKEFRDAKETGDQGAVDSALAAAESAQAEYENFRSLESQILRQIGGVSQQPGHNLEDSFEAQQTFATIAASSYPLQVNVHAGYLTTVEETVNLTGRMLAVAGQTTVPSVASEGPFLGIVDQPQEPLTFLDFWPSVPFEGRTIDFMRRDGGVAAAAIQQPGAIKQSAEIAYTPEEVEAVTIASWIKARRQDLDDVSGLMPDLQKALRYGVMSQVEFVLASSITATGSGVETVDTSGDANTPDKLLTATGELRAAGVLPNFIALNPTDATAAFKEREGANGGYLAGTPWAKLPPIVQTAALDEGQALTGDSRIAAALGVRSGISVAVGQESEDLIRNMVTILVEGRWAPMLLVPAALALVNLSA